MDKTLTSRQVIMTYLLITISPVIRDIPNIAVKKSGNGAIFAVIISFLMTVFLLFLVTRILNKSSGRNIYDIINDSAGRIAAKITVFLYALWAFLSAGVYMQYYAGRFNSTIMPYTSRDFFVAVMLVLVFLVFRKNIKTVCRISELSFPVITVILAILILLALPVINVRNFIPDNISVGKIICTGADIGSVGGYLMLTLFFCDRIRDPKTFNRKAFWGSIYFAVFVLAIFAVIIGINGISLTARLPLPFFTTVKQISSFGLVERVEPLLISIWLISDFIVISTFVSVCLLCIKWTFEIKKIHYFIIPILICLYIFSKLFNVTQFELEYFSATVMPAVNFAFQYVIPIFIFLLPRKEGIKKAP